MELRPVTLDDQIKRLEWLAQPETTRVWARRSGEWTKEKAEERFKRDADDPNGVSWSIAYEGETVGRHDLYGRGIASEAVRLRTRLAGSHLRLHRVHNWIALQNRGSRRANERGGYAQIGLYKGYAYRSGSWLDDWMGEVFPERVFTPEQP